MKGFVSVSITRVCTLHCQWPLYAASAPQDRMPPPLVKLSVLCAKYVIMMGYSIIPLNNIITLLAKCDDIICLVLHRLANTHRRMRPVIVCLVLWALILMAQAHRFARCARRDHHKINRFVFVLFYWWIFDSSHHFVLKFSSPNQYALLVRKGLTWPPMAR